AMPLTSNLRNLLQGYIFDAPADDRFAVLNPATGEVLTYVQDMGAAETTKAIGAASTAFAEWAGKTAKERSVILKKWNDLVLGHIDDLALLVTLEQGRPIRETRGEVTYAASFL